MLKISLTRREPEIRRRKPIVFRETHEEITREVPVDGTEVVEWMQKVGAINRVMSPWFNDYSEGGGILEAQSNDGWYPGVFTSSYQVFRRQTGDAVREDGYLRVDNRYGEEVARLRAFQRSFFDRLRGLVIETDLYRVQHNTLLAEIRKKISLPFSGELRLGSIDVAKVGYLSLPGVFRCGFLRPTRSIRLRVSYEAVNPGTFKVDIYDRGELVETGEMASDSGNITTTVTVKADTLISRKPELVIAYDGSETGINLYEVRSLFPISIL